MGAAAVRALLDEIAGLPAPRAEYVFRPELVVRGSTARRSAAIRCELVKFGGSRSVPSRLPS